MKLEYIDEHSNTIRVTLDEGESLGHLNGQVIAFVPTDLANVDYAAIVEGKYEIDPYVSEAKEVRAKPKR